MGTPAAISAREYLKGGFLLYFMAIYQDVTELIGKTPLMALNRMTDKESEALIIAKLEFFNPGSSIKDRIALGMLTRARERGLLQDGGTVVEPTSGNTGIGLAVVAAARGYNVLLVMPESMSRERRELLKAYGAQLVLTPAEEGMEGAIARARELAAVNKDYYLPQQFENYINPDVHRRTTALEILEETGEELHAFVSAVGTGGTLTGVGEILKGKNPQIQVVAVEPKNSPVLSGGEAGSTRIQGIGAGFIPRVLKQELIDRVITVGDEEAFQASQLLAAREGLFCGISSGASLVAARQLAVELGAGKKVVTVFPDSGERYLSMYSSFTAKS